MRIVLSFITPLHSPHILPQSLRLLCVFLLFPSRLLSMRHLHQLLHLRHHLLHLHLHLHLTLFQNHLSHVSSLVVPKSPLSFLLVLPPRPVLTRLLLMLLIIILMSHILFLMSYRLVHDIIYEIVVLFILKISMVFLV